MWRHHELIIIFLYNVVRYSSAIKMLEKIHQIGISLEIVIHDLKMKTIKISGGKDQIYIIIYYMRRVAFDSLTISFAA